jgi:hypothetical protein
LGETPNTCLHRLRYTSVSCVDGVLRRRRTCMLGHTAYLSAVSLIARANSVFSVQSGSSKDCCDGRDFLAVVHSKGGAAVEAPLSSPKATGAPGNDDPIEPSRGISRSPASSSTSVTHTYQDELPLPLSGRCTISSLRQPERARFGKDWRCPHEACPRRSAVFVCAPMKASLTAMARHGCTTSSFLFRKAGMTRTGQTALAKH